MSFGYRGIDTVLILTSYIQHVLNISYSKETKAVGGGAGRFAFLENNGL